VLQIGASSQNELQPHLGCPLNASKQKQFELVPQLLKPMSQLPPVVHLGIVFARAGLGMSDATIAAPKPPAMRRTARRLERGLSARPFATPSNQWSIVLLFLYLPPTCLCSFARQG
jgi:hypothetical protein